MYLYRKLYMSLTQYNIDLIVIWNNTPGAKELQTKSD